MKDLLILFFSSVAYHSPKRTHCIVVQWLVNVKRCLLVLTERWCQRDVCLLGLIMAMREKCWHEWNVYGLSVGTFLCHFTPSGALYVVRSLSAIKTLHFILFKRLCCVSLLAYVWMCVHWSRLRELGLFTQFGIICYNQRRQRANGKIYETKSQGSLKLTNNFHPQSLSFISMKGFQRGGKSFVHFHSRSDCFHITRSL